MTIYTGYQGGVTIRRWSDGDEPMVGTLSNDLVDTKVNRFEHPFHSAMAANQMELSPFITGDHVEITRIDTNPDGTRKDLTLIKGKKGSTHAFFVQVDPSGGLACYDTYDDAINNEIDARFELESTTEEQRVEVQPVGGYSVCLAQVIDYEFTTEREAVDVTSLGSEFREQYTRGLITGQGRLNCFWDFESAALRCNAGPGISEYSNYLLQLAQRVTYGADFLGEFFLHDDGLRSVWQQAECVITGCTFEVKPSEPIRSQIQFVTTGPFKLSIGRPKYEVLQEKSGWIVGTEDGGNVLQEYALD